MHIQNTEHDLLDKIDSTDILFSNYDGAIDASFFTNRLRVIQFTIKPHPTTLCMTNCTNVDIIPTSTSAIDAH